MPRWTSISSQYSLACARTGGARKELGLSLEALPECVPQYFVSFFRCWQLCTSFTEYTRHMRQVLVAQIRTLYLPSSLYTPLRAVIVGTSAILQSDTSSMDAQRLQVCQAMYHEPFWSSSKSQLFSGPRDSSLQGRLPLLRAVRSRQPLRRPPPCVNQFPRNCAGLH